MPFTKGTAMTWNGIAVAKLTNIPFPEGTAESIDVTTHDSVGRFREFIAGLIDNGELAIEGYYLAGDSGQAAMLSDFNAGTTREVVLTGPNSAYGVTFNAFITKLKRIGDAPLSGNVGFSGSLKISGAVDYSETASAGLTTPFFAVSDDAVVVPAAAGNSYEYVANVLNGVTSVTVTPTATAGVIKVNGNIVESGHASSAIALGAAGSVTTITITVTETNKVTKTYIIKVARAA